MSFSSLKASDSFTASALTIASRTRSWISRSSSGAADSDPPATLRRRSAALPRAILASATVPPRDHRSEPHVQGAEAHGHEGVTPPRGGEERRDTQEHGAEPH